MNGIELLVSHAVPFFLVLMRLAGLMFFTPILANRTIPRRVRIVLAFSLAVAVYPALPAAAQTAPEVDLVGLVPLVVGEVLLGLVLGFMAALPIIALDIAGFVMGHQMGLGMARVYNPEANADTDVLGQLLMYLGIACFVALGGLEAVMSALVGTFGRLPPGGLALAATPIDAIMAVFSSGFELALRVGTPVLCVIFMVMATMGLLSKTMPQLNVMTIGFTLKMVVGLAMLLLSVGIAQQAISGHIESTLRQIVGWAASLGASPTLATP
ncbi:flagellar biosynthetic protein FliR [Leptolyngbya sp. 15MV]|nr:flagellar biosynthetic protein FliR [Leptolyngbya sp. 15MV]